MSEPESIVLRIVHEVFAGQNWILFEHGSIITVPLDIADPNDMRVLADMTKMAELLGPYEGQGSSLGDCGAMKLRNFDGWLVTSELPLTTYVGPDEVAGKRLPVDEVFVPPADGRPDYVTDMLVAVIGRTKRNMDIRERKIVARAAIPT